MCQDNDYEDCMCCDKCSCNKYEEDMDIKVKDYIIEVGDIDWIIVEKYDIWATVITVKKNNELILSSEGKTREEFFNYLKFLIKDRFIVEEIKNIANGSIDYEEFYC